MLKNLWILVCGILGGLLAAGILLLLLAPARGQSIRLLPPPTPRPLTIHIIGEVHQPGVYRLTHGSILADAIAAAGGYTPRADPDHINLAEPVEDGLQIQIPAIPTPRPTNLPGTLTPADHENTAADGFVLNINTADAPALERLPGIGPATAKKIVDYRDSYGYFNSIEDLLRVSGIGPAKLEQIKDLVTVR